MKRKLVSMALLVVLALSLGVSASARWEDANTCSASLSFSGRTGTCTAVIRTSESTAKINATMTLYRIGSDGVLVKVASWTGLTGTGRLSTSKTYYNAVSGSGYRLAVSGTVTSSSGTSNVSAWRNATCP